MSYPATLTHPTVGTLSFLTATTPTGWPVDVANVQEEQLVSPGVDGMRWRVMQNQETPFLMTTVVDCQSYYLAVIAAQQYMKTKDGQAVTIQTVMAGINYRYRNVHIIDVKPVPTPGMVVGGGAQTNNVAHVIAVWTMVLLDTSTTGEID